MNISKIFAVFILCSLALTMVEVPEAGGEGVLREFKDVHINLKANSEFSPEFQHENDSEPQRKRVNAQYDQYGVILSNRQYVDVGTWTSDTVKGDMTLQGVVHFNLWFIVVEQNGDSNDPDWIFTFKYNDVTMAEVEISATASSSTEVIEIKTQAPLSEPINAVSGDSFSIEIQYRGWDDIEVYYDTVDYDTGCAISMNSVVMISATSSSAWFYDAWGLGWDMDSKYFCFVNYGGNVNMGNPDTVVDNGGVHEGDNGTNWELVKITFVDIDKGAGSDIVFSISYGPNGTSESWMMKAGEGASTEEDDSDDSNTVMIGGGVIVLLLVVVLAYLFVFKKNAEDEDEDDEEEFEDEEEDDEDEDDEDDE